MFISWKPIRDRRNGKPWRCDGKRIRLWYQNGHLALTAFSCNGRGAAVSIGPDHRPRSVPRNECDKLNRWNRNRQQFPAIFGRVSVVSLVAHPIQNDTNRYSSLRKWSKSSLRKAQGRSQGIFFSLSWKTLRRVFIVGLPYSGDLKSFQITRLAVPSILNPFR